ncbi:MAG: restriction endonuclease [Methylomicrobium sp.]|nr:restriction endonuclease [Methylomicrobium sp.]
MTKEGFEQLLDTVAAALSNEAKQTPFATAKQFENRVREVVKDTIEDPSINIDFDPHPQAFPDIAVGEFGIEVKFTTNDTWRSVANSVLETNRIDSVKFVYIVFGKMGGEPCVKWGEYEKSVMHVRTSHVPRFEVEIGTQKSLFEQMGISYDEFRVSEMHDKMHYIRQYARGRLKQGERLWWLEDSPGEEHTLPIQARLYTKLATDEKTKLRAEAVLLCPRIVESGRSKNKYDDVVLYLLTYHGVLCHQARDLFSAGSVANPNNDDNGGIYIERAIKLIEPEIRDASKRMEDALFVEYWGYSVPPQQRIKEWLRLADNYSQGWVPSKTLFLDDQ